MSSQSPKYFDDIFNCDCKNDNGNYEFENYWRNSGSCCDNLRLTIWIIFNIFFLVAVLFLCFKIRREKRDIERDLRNFDTVDGGNAEEISNSSVADSGTREPLNR